jgi:hypothetical protein
MKYLLGILGAFAVVALYAVAQNAAVGPVPGTSGLSSIVTGNWSTIGTGCTFTAVTGVTGGGAWKIVGTSSGTQNFCGKSIAASGSFTHTFVIYPMNPIDTGTTEAAVGFSDGTKLEYCSVAWTASDGAFTNGATYSALTGGSGASTSGFPYYSVNGLGPIYFQLSAASGTSLTCKISPDGVNWTTTIFDDTTPYLTTSELVVGVNSGTATHAGTMLLESYQ